MKKYLLTTFTFLGLMANSGRCQTIDTLIDVGGYRLYFHIIKGKGMPILFEGGAGADVTVWDIILKPIADITHATLITYDRAGFGKSELDTSNHDLDKHGILQGIQGLETGLKKLGYDGNIMLVAHSFGGFCATLYAARHPERVKAAVLIDANHVCWFTDNYVDSVTEVRKKLYANMKNINLKEYYMGLNLPNTVAMMRKTPFPATIPVIDLVAENVPPFPDSAGAVRWRACHRQFADAQPNRQGITAYGCAHFIFRDNPPLAISAIVKTYTGTLRSEQGDAIMHRFLSYDIEAINEERKRGVHLSENDLNSRGYLLLKEGKIKEAIEIFKLNITFFPTSDNCYDSLAEAYEAAGDKAGAIANYKRSLELNPKSQHSIERLKVLQGQ
jgi:alpha/beta hydrolase family protein/tetratricopeptide repeat protein